MRALTRGDYRYPFAQSRIQQMLRKRMKTLAFGIPLLLVVPIVLLRQTLFPRESAQLSKTKLGEDNFDWDSAPRFDLVCRAYSGGIKTFWNVFFPTYLLFWPIKTWKSSGLVIVLDDESEADHEMGTILSSMKLITPIRVRYETEPLPNTTCSNWRRDGYSRQQYSNFYADLYTDADYVGIIDSDAGFITPVVPSDLFENGKPRIIGINLIGMFTGHRSEITSRAHGGGGGVGQFMTDYSFPIMVKTAHFAQMRETIAANMGAATFEEAFHKICDKNYSAYSQFNIIANFLWKHLRDEYSWHIGSLEDAAFKGLTKDRQMATQDDSVTSKNIPHTFVMHHHFKKEPGYNPVLGPAHMYDFLCIGSDFRAGNCHTMQNRTERTTLVNELLTANWSVGNQTWRGTNNKHLTRVRQEGLEFIWNPENISEKLILGT